MQNFHIEMTLRFWIHGHRTKYSNTRESVCRSIKYVFFSSSSESMEVELDNICLNAQSILWWIRTIVSCFRQKSVRHQCGEWGLCLKEWILSASSLMSTLWGIDIQYSIFNMSELLKMVFQLHDIIIIHRIIDCGLSKYIVTPARPGQIPNGPLCRRRWLCRCLRWRSFGSKLPIRFDE